MSAEERKLWAELDPHSLKNKLRRYGAGGHGESYEAPRIAQRKTVSAYESCETDGCEGFGSRDLFRRGAALHCRRCGVTWEPTS